MFRSDGRRAWSLSVVWRGRLGTSPVFVGIGVVFRVYDGGCCNMLVILFDIIIKIKALLMLYFYDSFMHAFVRPRVDTAPPCSRSHPGALDDGSTARKSFMLTEQSMLPCCLSVTATLRILRRIKSLRLIMLRGSLFLQACFLAREGVVG